jgi:spore cortex formation protein SpoVR/YcgB (stage V sporulation)
MPGIPQEGAPETETTTVLQGKPAKPDQAKESKVHRLRKQELYTPKKRERKAPALLTVEQYLRKAKQDEAISDLIRSLHKTKVMSFEEWDREIIALLKKKTW